MLGLQNWAAINYAVQFWDKYQSSCDTIKRKKRVFTVVTTTIPYITMATQKHPQAAAQTHLYSGVDMV